MFDVAGSGNKPTNIIILIDTVGVDRQFHIDKISPVVNTAKYQDTLQSEQYCYL